MDTQPLWQRYGDGIYFFILKRVKDRAKAQDIFQNTFLKVHSHIHQLRDKGSAKSWAFRIARNELANYTNREASYAPLEGPELTEFSRQENAFCCFDRFLDELPETYFRAVQLVYLEDKKQAEAADILDISLPNLKARLRRAKEILKTNFQECCNYAVDAQGQLTGEADCGRCG